MLWPIETALQASEIDRVIVSTDDPEMRSLALEYGVEACLRRPELAEDDSLVVDVIRDFWHEMKVQGETAEILVLLEATSPFRSLELISRCLNRLV